MKKIRISVVLVFIFHVAFSQTWNEWFRQKKTQIEYLQKQIIALQAYIEVAQKGYAIYRDGLTVIGDLKDGDFNLHHNYFASLKKVKPFIARAKSVEEIREWASGIQLIGNEVLQINLASQHEYLKGVFESLSIKVSDCLKETVLLTTDGHYGLSDQQRFHQLDKQHEHIKEYYGFARWMQRQVVVITHGTGADAADAKGLRDLLDFK